jgi:iron complex transport system substrate-binding protein
MLAGSPGRVPQVHLRRVVAAVAAMVVVLAGCSNEPSPRNATGSPGSTFPVTVTDDEGAAVTLAAAPQRIITFAPSNTEIVFALGLGDRLVGVSGDFDNYPPAASEIEHVGGAGEFGVDPNVEKVVSLRPDLFLAIAGGSQWKDQLRRLEIPVFTVNATDFDDLLQDIRTIGRLTGVAGEAEQLTERMQDRAADVAQTGGTGDRTSCFFEAFYPPLTTVGPDTFIFDLLERAGCDPVSAGARSDYPQWSVDRLVQQSPEVYLVSSESGVSAESVKGRAGFQAIGAVREGRVHLVNSDLITRPGPRVVEGLELLAELFYPAAA